MNRIRPWLFIGKYRDTIDYTWLRAYEIGSMLLLAEPVDHPGIVSLYLAVDDGVPLTDDALICGANFVLEQKQAGRSTLIACGAGQSRSVVFGIAALKEGEGLSLMDALCAIRSQHPDAEPHQALWESLCRYYGEHVPYLAMLKALEMKR